MHTFQLFVCLVFITMGLPGYGFGNFVDGGLLSFLIGHDIGQFSMQPLVELQQAWKDASYQLQLFVVNNKLR